jgi:hypothetical protein
MLTWQNAGTESIDGCAAPPNGRLQVASTRAQRYVGEPCSLSAVRALRNLAQGSKKSGRAYVALDETLISVDEIAAD